VKAPPPNRRPPHEWSWPTHIVLCALIIGAALALSISEGGWHGGWTLFPAVVVVLTAVVASLLRRR
jgi:hypothetical protein